MIVYFGEPWNLAARRGVNMPMPRGEACILCREPFQDGDRGMLVISVEHGREYQHPECLALQVVGHDYGVCTCTGFDTTKHTTALGLWRVLQGPPPPRS